VSYSQRGVLASNAELLTLGIG